MFNNILFSIVFFLFIFSSSNSTNPGRNLQNKKKNNTININNTIIKIVTNRLDDPLFSTSHVLRNKPNKPSTTKHQKKDAKPAVNKAPHPTFLD